MLRDITKLKVQGANFISVTELPLLCENSDAMKVSLLYGRNGAGKSTIARAFRKIRGSNISSVAVASLTGIGNANITLTEEEKAHIFVFDDDFVYENVRVREEGLGSIVMLGEQVGLSEMIDSVMSELHDAEADCQQKREIVEEYSNQLSDKSPKKYIEKMKEVLQRDDGWAGRKRIIDETRRNASVFENTYMDFLNLKPEKRRDELLVDFSAEMEKLKNAQSGATEINLSVPSIPKAYIDYETDPGNKLLCQIIEHPELSEREQYLLSLVQQNHGEELKSTAQEFSSPEIIICPKCFQPLSEQYKSDLITNIQRVLSEEVKEHQRRLKNIQIQNIEIDLSAFQKLQSYQSCVNQIFEINQIIQNNNGLLNSKITDPYTPIQKKLVSLSDSIFVLKNRLAQLESERIIHNRSVTDTKPIKKTLTRINNEIAYWDVIDLFRVYEIKKKEEEVAITAFNTAASTVKEIQLRLNNLNSQRENTNIAIDVINDGLKYIFFSENRLQIIADKNNYRLICNGHPVTPKDVSVGERNIIGLCYFFTSILNGKNKDAAFGEEYLLIIDDPVSSYDLENRVGILSFLKFKLNNFLLGNKETRVLLMTHDLLTFYDLEKLCEEIVTESKKLFRDNGIKYTVLELKENSVGRFSFRKRNEYTELINLIYQYANGQATEYDVIIGNIMRQALEAFSMFEYKDKIEKVTVDIDVLSALEAIDPAYRYYFENLMYRLVLHGGSHKENQIKAMETEFFSMISETEKRRTAKEVLCFIYLLNKAHLKAHLIDNYPDAIIVLDGWCEDIRNRALQTP